MGLLQTRKANYGSVAYGPQQTSPGGTAHPGSARAFPGPSSHADSLALCSTRMGGCPTSDNSLFSKVQRQIHSRLQVPGDIDDDNALIAADKKEHL
jgi:hypothetical protein